MEREFLIQQVLKRALKKHMGQDPQHSLTTFARFLKMDREKVKRVLEGKIPYPDTLEKLRERLSISDEAWHDIDNEISDARSNHASKWAALRENPKERDQKRRPNRTLWDELE